MLAEEDRCAEKEPVAPVGDPERLLALADRSTDLFLLDEPTSGLDPFVQQEFHAIIREHADAGTAVALSSHVLSEVERVADRVAIIRAGQLIMESLARLRECATHTVEVRFASPPPHDPFAAVDGIRDVRQQGSVLHRSVQGRIDALIKVIANYDVVDLFAALRLFSVLLDVGLATACIAACATTLGLFVGCIALDLGAATVRPTFTRGIAAVVLPGYEVYRDDLHLMYSHRWTGSRAHWRSEDSADAPPQDVAVPGIAGQTPNGCRRSSTRSAGRSGRRFAWSRVRRSLRAARLEGPVGVGCPRARRSGRRGFRPCRAGAERLHSDSRYLGHVHVEAREAGWCARCWAGTRCPVGTCRWRPSPGRRVILHGLQRPRRRGRDGSDGCGR